MADSASKSTTLIRDRDSSIQRDLNNLRLTVIAGPDTGRSCDIGDRQISVGSDSDNDLVLVDETVSRHHLLARREQSGVWIQDQGSSNGTFFEGSKVREMVVGVGGSFTMGTTVLTVVPQEKTLRPEPTAEPDFFGVIGASLRMREIFSILGDLATSDLTILLEGETGTGKEAMAEAIHQASARKDKPFVVVDCTTIPNDLVESELFGHCQGAFTGATSDRVGCFEEANLGTVFIDEIGDLPANLQPKLLRVLEKRQLRPVGSSKTVNIDVRVIAASNKCLKDEVAAGNFRQDLYYRLAVVAVTIPPLRERLEDLSRLIEHFAKITIPAAALTQFSDYPWPGNVRELRNVVERAVALKKGDSLDSFLAEMGRGIGEQATRPPDKLPFKQAKSQMVAAFERAYLADLFERHQGNVSQAAKEAGLDRHHLADLLKKHQIKD